MIAYLQREIKQHKKTSDQQSTVQKMLLCGENGTK